MLPSWIIVEEVQLHDGVPWVTTMNIRRWMEVAGNKQKAGVVDSGANILILLFER